MKVIKKQNNSDYCLICGVNNPAGLVADFYEMEDKSVVAKINFKKEHQSYPGRVHGGMISALLDELVGRAIWVYDPNQWGVTMQLNVKFRKPVPYETELKAVGRIDNQTSRTFMGSGQILDKEGNILAEATATYMKLPLDKIADIEGDTSAADVFIPDNVTEID